MTISKELFLRIFTKRSTRRTVDAERRKFDVVRAEIKLFCRSRLGLTLTPNKNVGTHCALWRRWRRRLWRGHVMSGHRSGGGRGEFLGSILPQRRKNAINVPFTLGRAHKYFDKQSRVTIHHNRVTTVWAGGGR